MISVIIPCHKSKIDLLNNCLRSLKNQNFEEYEVIVVSNPANEEIEKLVESFPSHFTHISSELGSNNARNAGISKAKYPTIAITDDDTLISPEWLRTIDNLFSTQKDISCAGGPLIPIFTGTQPRWLEGELLHSLSLTEHPTDSLLTPRRLKRSEWLVSANLAFPRSMWKKVGGFNGDIGLHGLKKDTSNDELAFIKRCSSHGRVIYDPRMRMEHQIPPERACEEYIYEREYGQGAADIEMYFDENPKGTIANAYHDIVQGAYENLYYSGGTSEVRIKISDENLTREYIRILLKAKLCKIVGMINKLEGKDIWIKNDK